MKSRKPKVLHAVGGRPMLAHVYDTAKRLGPETVHVVFNPDCPEVRDCLPASGVTWVSQAPRLGTGHAVQQAMPGIPDEGHVLVLYGDLPLVTTESLQALLDRAGDGLAVLTMRLDDPNGYGRIVRDADGSFAAIVEDRDASDAQRGIDEVNTGIMLAPASRLRGWLAGLRDENSQGEYYLTDVVGLARAEGGEVEAIVAPEARDLAGANDAAQLAALESRLRARRAQALMQAGVQLADPARIDVRGEVRSGADVRLDINVVLEGTVELGDGVSIGPGCVLRDCVIAAGTRIHAYSVLEGVRTLGA
ncbi:MAG: NTP transferase domain-containing protein, partial [Xanthomonadales bacterium]|nr:NTP transferase domain-containing protein [Xanthomonadales bacterium]